MGAPWVELSSAERLDAVLLAVAELDDEERTAHAGAVADRVNRRHGMDLAAMGRNGRCNGMRRMSTATRVTPAITALRNRGLLALTRRIDEMSGTADAPTREGWKRVRELRADTTKEKAMDTLEQRMALVKERTGFDEEEPARAVLEHEGFTWGDRVRVIEDDEDNGLFEGDEGFVIIGNVGSAEYRNERVMLAFLGDGFTDPNQCTADQIEAV